VFQPFALQPHRSRSFKLSADPFFIEKVRDTVGLYLNPPDHALVLCVDEKSQIQALNRTQPVLPMGLGYLEGVTHDYVRHGTTTLFAAVFTECKPRHRHQEFLSFLRRLDAQDNWRFTLSWTTTPRTSIPRCEPGWPATPLPHPLHAHLLLVAEPSGALVCPDYATRDPSRLVPQRERSDPEDRFLVQHYNRSGRPFVWTATIDSILEKLARLCSRISGTQH
jgi:putative transposase